MVETIVILDCERQEEIRVCGLDILTFSTTNLFDSPPIEGVDRLRDVFLKFPDLSGMLPSKFENFQLVVRKVHHTRGSPLETRSWVIEMGRAAAKEHFGEFFKTFNPKARIKIVTLMDPKIWDRNITLANFFVGQNRMLHNAVVIKVDRLQDMDEFYDKNKGTTQTLHDQFMTLQSNGSAVFQSISQFNSKRVCFITTQKHQAITTTTIDDFLLVTLTSLPTAEYKKHTFIGRKPAKIGKRDLLNK